MKKSIIVFIVCLFCISTTVDAQFFKSGILFGVNGSQITGDDMAGFDKGGLLLGPFVEHELSSSSCIRMELTYSMKGSAYNINRTRQGIWNLYRVSYIEVPIMYDRIVYQKFGITGGLAFGFMVNEHYVDKYNSVIPDFSLAKKTEFSYLIGGIYNHSERLNVFIRYQSSIINFSTADNTPFFQLWGQRRPGYLNVVASFGARYYFGQK
jgi:hypothetical protein